MPKLDDKDLYSEVANELPELEYKTGNVKIPVYFVKKFADVFQKVLFRRAEEQKGIYTEYMSLQIREQKGRVYDSLPGKKAVNNPTKKKLVIKPTKKYKYLDN